MKAMSHMYAQINVAFCSLPFSKVISMHMKIVPYHSPTFSPSPTFQTFSSTNSFRLATVLPSLLLRSHLYTSHLSPLLLSISAQHAQLVTRVPQHHNPISSLECTLYLSPLTYHLPRCSHSTNPQPLLGLLPLPYPIRAHDAAPPF